MKKTLMLVLIIMVFCNICGAFEQPDPSRWTEIACDTTNTITYWIDTKTLRFEKRYDGNYAIFWAMYHITGEDSYIMSNFEMNMDKREYKSLSITKYDSSGKATSAPSPQGWSEGIPPGSVLEVLYDAVSNIQKE